MGPLLSTFWVIYNSLLIYLFVHSPSLPSCIPQAISRLTLFRCGSYKTHRQYKIFNSLPSLTKLGSNSLLILALKTLENEQTYTRISSKVIPLHRIHRIHISAITVCLVFITILLKLCTFLLLKITISAHQNSPSLQACLKCYAFNETLFHFPMLRTHFPLLNFYVVYISGGQIIWPTGQICPIVSY